MFFLLFSRNASPNPALVINPAIADPKLIEPWIYKSVIITLEAQFGINPIREETTGVRYLYDVRKFDIFVSPI